MALLRNLADWAILTHRLYHDPVRRIRSRQLRALVRLVRLARQKSPYYQETLRGLPLRSLSDYRRFPQVDKAEMMEHFDTLNTVGARKDEVMAYALDKERRRDDLGYWRGRFVVGLSSGTSGNKGLYLTPRSLTRRLPGVFLARGGVRLSDLPLRILFILRVFSQGFADINAPLIRLRYLHSMTPPADILDAFNAMDGNVLMAPPSVLRQLLPFRDRLARPPRRILTYAEVLEPEEKARFARVFGAPVAEIYQASEGQIASPCRCGTLHINEDLAYVELEDEDGTPVTEPGRRPARMLVTNLVNGAQPLIRYRMNDLVELGGPCPCGSRFRTLARVIGRQDDVLYLQDRNGVRRAVFPDLASRWIITTDDRIREFQVEQVAPDRLRIALDLGIGAWDGTVPLPGAEQGIVDALEARFREELAAYDIPCGLDFQVRPIPLPADNRKLKRFLGLPA